MPAPSDLVHETSSSTGTGNFTLSNVNGKRSFNTAFGTGGTDLFDYFIMNRDAAEWERGTGHLSAASTLVRDTVKASSNSNNAVNFSAGTKDVTNDVPAARQLYTDESNNVSPSIASINSGQIGGFRNALINGSMLVSQRATSFTDSGAANNDNSPVLDRWVLLSNGNDIVDVSQDTADVPTNGLYAAKMLVATVNKKFGLLQVIEQKNCIGLIGNTVTLSFKAKVSNTTRLATCKAVILSWSGTADTVTRDVVSAWGADGTTPTWATNWTAENTPADLNFTTSWASYSISGAIDTASTKNIAVFIWSDNETDTDAGDTMHITDVQLEVGSQATVIERIDFAMVIDRCQRYYEKSYDLATKPGTSSVFVGAKAQSPQNATPASGEGITFMTRKRQTPSVTIYSPNDGATGNGYDSANRAITVNNPGETGFYIDNDFGNASGPILFHYAADAEL